MRALIAVAGRPVEPGGVKGWPSANAVAAPGSYLEAIHRAGGREAVLMPTPIGTREAEKMLARFDGLLLLGGGDVDPSRYGAEVHPRTYGIRTNRDEFEVAVVETALSQGVPLLAICRGLQVLNVALGGTLEQHIADRGGPIDHGFGPEWTTHPVKLESESLVAEAMGATETVCSSHHHQSIDRLGDGLRAVGWAADGIIEAAEREDGWVLGVQWHPEMTAATDSAQQALFDALVDRAARRREGTGTN